MAMYAAVSYTVADQSSTALGTEQLQTAQPQSLSRLPDDDNWKDVKAALGAQYAGVATAAPTVLVSKTPAELMLLNGGAAYTPVKGTHLEWVSNTDSDVFRLENTGTVYEMPAR
jgi:hypothetical protein